MENGVKYGKVVYRNYWAILVCYCNYRIYWKRLVLTL